MEFEQPPTEMQVDPAHWDLGPERIGPGPWVCELCLVHGDRRRWVVVRHGNDTIESMPCLWMSRPRVTTRW
jgi:hypothetical protein